jgi:hypothetical protein
MRLQSLDGAQDEQKGRHRFLGMSECAGLSPGKAVPEFFDISKDASGATHYEIASDSDIEY